MHPDHEEIRVYLLSSFYTLGKRFWGKALPVFLHVVQKNRKPADRVEPVLPALSQPPAPPFRGTAGTCCAPLAEPGRLRCFDVLRHLADAPPRRLMAPSRPSAAPTAEFIFTTPPPTPSDRMKGLFHRTGAATEVAVVEGVKWNRSAENRALLLALFHY